MNLFVGTSGFSYKEWKGPFYPDKIPAKQMLAFYGERLPAVEINNTFYQMPKPEVLTAWAEQVPESFRFSIKASRRITHFRRLNNTEEVVDHLLTTIAVLGERLGAVLFQLPPNFKKDFARLEAFLATLPTDVRAAFEFRNPSWFDDEVFDALRSHGAALVTADTDDTPGEIISTAPWGYLRLRGTGYSDAEVAAWADRVAAQDWDDAFVFFKHEGAGVGPKFAETFLAAS